MQSPPACTGRMAGLYRNEFYVDGSDRMLEFGSERQLLTLDVYYTVNGSQIIVFAA